MTAALFPAGLLGLAVTMILAHARNWRRAQVRPLSPDDREFRHEQFRRRMQASCLLALIGPAIFVGQQVRPDASPKLFVMLWLAVTVATCWIIWLALLDALASGRYFRRLSLARRADRTRLRQELDDLVTEARIQARSATDGE